MNDLPESVERAIVNLGDYQDDGTLEGAAALRLAIRAALLRERAAGLLTITSTPANDAMNLRREADALEGKRMEGKA